MNMHHYQESIRIIVRFYGFGCISHTKIQGEENNREICMPCGTCRQVLSEFVSSDFKIYAAKSREEYKVFTMAELLPYSFSEKNLFSF